MKIQNQVCPRKLSQKLVELGVKIKPYLWWRNDYPNNPSKYRNKWYIENEYQLTIGEKPVKYEKGWHLLPAYSVAELGEIINSTIEIVWETSYSHHLGDWNWEILDFDVDPDKYPAGFKVDEQGNCEYLTEAEARAELLIYLIEHKKVDVKQINKWMK